MSGQSDSAANGGPQPRLCHVVKVDTFDGYGFNLLAEQGRPGQYIGKVDKGSPAEQAGLRQGDKILEVNGVSIAKDNHKQVVQKIKAVQGETKLLVVTPPPNERIPQPKSEDPEPQKKPEPNHQEPKKQEPKKPEPKPQEPKKLEISEPIPQEPKILEEEEKPEPITRVAMTNGSPKEDHSPVKDQPDMSKLNLGMSVAEMRARLAAKKKADPKKTSMDFKSKFEIVKQL